MTKRGEDLFWLRGSFLSMFGEADITGGRARQRKAAHRVSVREQTERERCWEQDRAGRPTFPACQSPCPHPLLAVLSDYDSTCGFSHCGQSPSAGNDGYDVSLWGHCHPKLTRSLLSLRGRKGDQSFKFYGDISFKAQRLGHCLRYLQ